MNKIFFFIFTLLTTTAHLIAFSQSLPNHPWSGTYFGVNIGHLGTIDDKITNKSPESNGFLNALLQASVIPTSLHLKHSNAIGGIQGGYNWQIRRVVFGAEGDWSWLNARDQRLSGPTNNPGFPQVVTSYERSLRWLGTVRGRIGFSVTQQLLIYGTGGFAAGRTTLSTALIGLALIPPTTSQPSTAHTSKTNSYGWTAGAGLEWMFYRFMGLRVEYLYADLGRQHSTIAYTDATGTNTLTSTIHNSFGVLRTGLNVYF